MMRIREIVSKKRRRYKEDGFDLDLSYINNNIIAMGFPAEKLEGVYRNHIDDVVRFLEMKHKNYYKVYNLCCERRYDASKFPGPVENGFPFKDHNPPSISILKSFCENVDSWLSANANNVAVIHCKAGKGRTGVMVCSYLLHKYYCHTADEALNYYGKARTHDCKGVTIPSQKRYVEYYAELVTKRLEYKPTRLLLNSIELSPVPTFNNGTCTPYFVVYMYGSKKKIFVSSILEPKKNASSLFFLLPSNVQVSEDVKIVMYNKPKMMKKEKMLQFWFNTFFVEMDQHPTKGKDDHPTNGCMISSWTKNLTDKSASSKEAVKLLSFVLTKEQLDKPHKDRTNKLFPSDFKVELCFTKCPEDSTTDFSSHLSHHRNDFSGGLETSDNDSDTETEDEEDWEEGTHV